MFLNKGVGATSSGIFAACIKQMVPAVSGRAGVGRQGQARAGTPQSLIGAASCCTCATAAWPPLATGCCVQHVWLEARLAAHLLACLFVWLFALTGRRPAGVHAEFTF